MAHVLLLTGVLASHWLAVLPAVGIPENEKAAVLSTMCVGALAPAAVDVVCVAPNVLPVLPPRWDAAQQQLRAMEPKEDLARCGSQRCRQMLGELLNAAWLWSPVQVTRNKKTYLDVSVFETSTGQLVKIPPNIVRMAVQGEHDAVGRAVAQHLKRLTVEPINRPLWKEEAVVANAATPVVPAAWERFGSTVVGAMAPNSVLQVAWDLRGTEATGTEMEFVVHPPGRRDVGWCLAGGSLQPRQGESCPSAVPPVGQVDVALPEATPGPWKWTLRTFAGGRDVALKTGYAVVGPSTGLWLEKLPSPAFGRAGVVVDVVGRCANPKQDVTVTLQLQKTKSAGVPTRRTLHAGPCSRAFLLEVEPGVLDVGEWALEVRLLDVAGVELGKVRHVQMVAPLGMPDGLLIEQGIGDAPASLVPDLASELRNRGYRVEVRPMGAAADWIPAGGTMPTAVLTIHVGTFGGGWIGTVSLVREGASARQTLSAERGDGGEGMLQAKLLEATLKGLTALGIKPPPAKPATR